MTFPYCRLCVLSREGPVSRSGGPGRLRDVRVPGLYWLARRYLPNSRREPGRLDLPGVAVLTVAVLLLVEPLVLGQDAGWPAWTWACLAASVPAFALAVTALAAAALAGLSVAHRTTA